jgi:hypothetical protein
MDLSQYNARAKAEAGAFVGLCDPYTGKPIKDDGKQPGFMVRGVASKSVQTRLAEMQRAAKDADDGEDMDAVLERLHRSQIDSAMGYIIRAVDLEHDGKPVDDNQSAIRAILDFTFPDMKVVKGETVEITDDEGNTRKVPKFEIVNKTFAGQVIEAAEDGQRFFGKTAKG